jgi:hypothetical protein
MIPLVEITEEVKVSVLLEETASGQKEKQYYIEGVFMQGDIVNKNKRVYPFPLLKESVDGYSKNFISSGRAMGELGHPTDPNQYTSINLDRVSHKIVSLSESGKNFEGKAKILSTPYGKIVKNLMDEGIKFGISSRALGNVKEENGVKKVHGDFLLITPGDIVADPSAPDAFVTNLMENKEWIWENGRLATRETEIKKIINNSKLNEEKLLEVFRLVLEEIR